MVRTTQRKATKTHICTMCGREIKPKSEYMDYYDQEERFGYAMHIHCDAIWTAFCMTHPEDADECEDPILAVEEWLGDACALCDRNSADAKLCVRFTCPHLLDGITELRPETKNAVMESAGWGGWNA